MSVGTARKRSTPSSGTLARLVFALPCATKSGRWQHSRRRRRHIAAVGFDLYCQLLRQAAAQLKGDKRGWRVEVDLRLDFVATNEAEFAQFGPEERVPAFIPISYIADTALRIQAYRHLAEISTHEQLQRLRKAWRDRFGKPPSAIDNLFLLTEIKLAAWG